MVSRWGTPPPRWSSLPVTCRAPGSPMIWIRILETSGERRIEGIVVGMPYSLDGTHGTQAKQVNGFINALRKRTSIPIYTIDERFTSVEAEALIRESGRQPSRERGSVDEAAAALILQRFLAARGDDFA